MVKFHIKEAVITGSDLPTSAPPQKHNHRLSYVFGDSIGGRKSSQARHEGMSEKGNKTEASLHNKNKTLARRGLRNKVQRHNLPFSSLRAS